MKKLITILAIMIVLVGAAFAVDPVASDSNGNAVINITCTIKEEFPHFQLAVVDGATVVTSKVGETKSTELSPTNVTALTADSGTVTVNFKVEQNNKSRTVAQYKLYATATDLAMTRKAGADSDLTTTPGTTQKFTVVGGTDGVAHPAITADVSSISQISTDSGVSSPKVGLIYNGVMIDGSTTAIQVAHFAVAWNANKDAEPGAYKATITLNVEAY